MKTDADFPEIVTDLEIAEAVYTGNLETSTAGELARPAPVLRPSDSVGSALARMHESNATHAVVVGPSRRLVGVLSVLDVVECILRYEDQMRP